MATKDTAPCEVVSDHLTAEERYAGYDALKKHHSKTVADLYKDKVSTTQIVWRKQ